MQAIDAILSRRTVPQAKMTGPGPDAGQIQTLLEAAMAAPDHGKLQPWRFLKVAGDARAKLGALMADSLAAEDPSLSEEQLARTREVPLKAPLILVVAAALQPDHPRIPKLEQLCAAAAAAQNVLIAAHAMGFAAKWSSGKAIFSKGVHQGLGLGAQDELLGFLYIGHYAVDHPAPPRPAPETRCTDWLGTA